MTNETRRSSRRLGRWFSPAGFVLAGLFLLMPFVTVSCDAPGGFGRTTPGGTTTYTGLDLATGSAPGVTAEHLRPLAEVQPDRLGPQPLFIALVVLILAGVAAAIAGKDPLVRRAVAAIVAGVAAVFLVAGQATARALLEARLREQLTVPIPVGHTAGDYVQTQGVSG